MGVMSPLLALLAGLALSGEVLSAEEVRAPSEASLVYFNARLALREERPLDAARLWFLRNALKGHTDHVSPYDEDFHSVTWAALGELGLCQDGFARDVDGAGLWPLATYNQLVRTRNRPGVDRSNPYKAFDVGRQQRFVQIDSVLDHQELRTLRLSRGACLRPLQLGVEQGGVFDRDLSERDNLLEVLRFLLERARVTLAEDVRGQAVIEARLFDVELQLAELARRKARQKAREQGRLARLLGLSRVAAEEVRDDERDFAFSDDSEPARVLRRAAGWSADEWLSLSTERRLFLFDQARLYNGEDQEAAFEARAREILDVLVAEGDGEAAMQWVARIDEEAAWRGPRGARLLGLDDDAGFAERSVIALRRGVDALQTGERDRALRAFAFAVTHAGESSRAGEVRSLALRWLTFVATQYEITDGLLMTLQELLPDRDYSTILEDLMWSAAFRADASSFRYGLDNQLGRGALGRRLAVLAPLAEGDVTTFGEQVAVGLVERPSETLRFLDRLVQRLELEDPEVRVDQRPTLFRIRRELEPLADPAGSARQARRADALLERTLALLEGTGGLGEDPGLRDRARSLSPEAEIFAGSVRIAPSDPIPWPFRATEARAPSILEPMALEPEEWRHPDGSWTFGWRIRG